MSFLSLFYFFVFHPPPPSIQALSSSSILDQSLPLIPSTCSLASFRHISMQTQPRAKCLLSLPGLSRSVFLANSARKKKPHLISNRCLSYQCSRRGATESLIKWSHGEGCECHGSSVQMDQSDASEGDYGNRRGTKRTVMGVMRIGGNASSECDEIAVKSALKHSGYKLHGDQF